MILIRRVRERMAIKPRQAEPRFALTVAIFIVLGSLALNSEVLAGDLDKVVPFNIQAETLDKALLQFGAQAHVQISFASKNTRARIRSVKLVGSYTGLQVLTELLRGSGLGFVKRGNTVEIVPTGAKSSLDPKTISEAAGQTESAHPTESEDGRPQESHRQKKEESSVQLEEVLVTGTLISGTSPASPLIELSSQDIQASGVSTLGQLMQRLPDNFGGGANPGTLPVSTETDNTSNLSQGSSINLRGLGADSTLVLVNGHRMALSGEGSFVDISMIPVSAISRIEILTDGASATYGSDAIGGVANIILLKHFDGAESGIKYGGATDGGTRETQAFQLLGGSTQDSSAVFDYEYYDDGRLPASERPFSKADRPADLLPYERRNSIYSYGSHNFSNNVDGSLFSMMSFRDMDDHFNPALPGGALDFSASESQIDVGGSLRLHLPMRREIVISPEYSRNYVASDRITTLVTYHERDDFELGGVELKADGPITSLPGGDVDGAFGGNVRTESLRIARNVLAPVYLDTSRKITSAFGEIQVPLIGARQSIKGVEELRIDIAGRYDHYSDFGAAWVPKLGVIWRAYPSLTMRSTFGRSFKAPSFLELYGQSTSVTAYDPAVFGIRDPGSASGSSVVLEVNGSNPTLKPETATEWTFGPEWRLDGNGPVSAGADYFSIDFRNRIAYPTQSPFAPFVEYPEFEGVLNRAPTLGEVSSLLAIPNLFNFYGPLSPSAVTVIFDDRDQNISRTAVRGLDAHAKLNAQVGQGAMEFGVDGTYLLSFENQLTQQAPEVDSVNTIFNPLRLRIRSYVGIELGSLADTISLNYTGRYVNNTIAPPMNVGSWTTVDMSLTKRAGEWKGPLKGVEVGIDVLNLLNRAPPGVVSPALKDPIGFDPTNASPIGRFVSLEVRTKW